MNRIQKWIAMVVVMLAMANAYSQPLRNINFRYAYDPGEPVRFDIRPVRLDSGWTVFSKLYIQDTTLRPAEFTVQWETRPSLGAETGDTLKVPFEVVSATSTSVSYRLSLGKVNLPTVLVARVINRKVRVAWIYYTILSSNFPVNMTASADGEVLVRPFLSVGSLVMLPALTTSM